jgi:hypothetical protein
MANYLPKISFLGVLAGEKFQKGGIVLWHKFFIIICFSNQSLAEIAIIETVFARTHCCQ